MNELIEFLRSTGAANIDWRQGIMLVVGIIFVYLAISSSGANLAERKIVVGPSAPPIIPIAAA